MLQKNICIFGYPNTGPQIDTKIGLKALQVTTRNILFSLSFTLFLITFVNAQEVKKPNSITIPAEKDSINVPVTIVSELLESEKNQDSTTTDSIKKSNDFLTGKVAYKAKDYMRLSKRENKMYLHDEAEIIYDDLQINAGLIIVDNEKSEVYAYGITDSTDTYVQTPIFKQGQNIIEPDSIRFNFKTEKALIYNSKTEQNGFNIYNEVSKRENDSVIYMSNVKFTTSDNIEDPEYYFYARRIKYVPKKKIVTGLVNMYIAEVPTPLGLPFGFFPMSDKRTSGFILPSFGDDNNRGYFLQNGGYYFAISDYADLTVQGDYYTNGSYAIRTDTDYAKRYRFRGNVSVRFEKILNSEFGFPDYTRRNIYNIRWSHSKDQKSNPNSRFTANVNLGSSSYYNDTRNQASQANFLNNDLSSSINYSRTFNGEPQISLDVNASHRQNTQTRAINMTLPTVNLTASRIFPFAPKVGVKKGIIHNINMQYTFRGENRFDTTDDFFFRSEMFENAQLGMEHTIPISTNFKLFKYISASASTNFKENWVFKTIERKHSDDVNIANRNAQGIVQDTLSGFDAFRTYNFSTSLGTTIYGTFNRGKDKKIQAIRHVITPSVSYNINPKFDQFYDQYTIEKNLAEGRLEDEIVEYSRFEDGFYSPPSNIFSSSIGFSVTNQLEAKVRDRDSTATDPKKIKLLNNLSISSSYNLAGDEFKLSPFGVNGGIPIIEGKLDINFSMSLDPYALNSSNQRIEEWNINNGGSLFRLTSANTAFGYSFSSKDFQKDKKDETENRNDETFRNGGRKDDLFGVGADPRQGSLFNGQNTDKKDTKDRKFYRSNLPWDLRIGYKVNYSNSQRQNEISSHSINFSGNLELSPRWKIGFNSGYDLKDFGFTYTQFRFERDLESWRMNFSWTPFGPRTTWNYFIGIKSSILSDIKWEKRRVSDRRL